MEYFENLVWLPDIETELSFSGFLKHEFKLKLQHSHTSRWTRPRHALSTKMNNDREDGHCYSFA